MDKYKEIIAELIQFTTDRDWDQFHDSKDLALAISIEAAELNELFLWKKIKKSSLLTKTGWKRNWPTFYHTLYYWQKSTI